MSEDTLNVKWRMLSSTHFEGKANEYDVNLWLGGFYPIWEIYKEGTVVDSCVFHSPTKCELSAKVQIQKIITTIINQ